MAPIALRENRIGDGPPNGDGRIVPGDADFVSRIVEGRALVLDLGDRAHHAEAVGEAGGHVTLPEIVGRQGDADPTAEGWRVRADVDGHVKNLALDHVNQLPLRTTTLQVQSA